MVGVDTDAVVDIVGVIEAEEDEAEVVLLSQRDTSNQEEMIIHRITQQRRITARLLYNQ